MGAQSTQWHPGGTLRLAFLRRQRVAVTSKNTTIKYGRGDELLYAVLHAHTAKGSVGDSILKIDDYVRKAQELGITHIAMTDHGSMASMVEFHEACKKAGITGIIGMEAYVVPDRTLKDNSETSKCNWHLILLAKNAEGVKNLLRIHNDAQINGFYYKARTDYSMLKKYGKNLIALSACVGGEIPQLILQGNARGAVEAVRRYQACFDEFYLEIQPGHFEEQAKVNDVLVQMSKASGIPLVATNDIHYLGKDDYIMHDLHVKSCRNQKDDNSDLVYPDTCYYLMSEEELSGSFLRSQQVTDEVVKTAIANTNLVAAQCDGEVDYHFEMPKFPDLPEGETEESYLVHLCQTELHRRMMSLRDPVKYEERLMYELDVILKLGFAGYFLIVKDFLDHARKVGIAVGPGRGSVGGSLVAWLLNITVADPVKYHLMFERFLNPNRKGLPDIDVDLQSDRRNEVKDYVIEKYGREHTALVGSFVIQKAKAAIHAAARLMNVDLDTANAICKAAPFRVTDDNGEEVKAPTIQQMLDDSSKFRSFQIQYPELFKTAMDIESFPKTYGIHAAGIVISPENILEKLPIRVDKETGRYISMVDKNFIEKVCIKYDFLALNTAATIDQTVKDAGISIDWNDDDFYHDEKVWKAIGSSNTIGMFQISSNLYRQRMPRLHPTKLQEMAACLALVRGPCVSAKTDEVYMDTINGKRDIMKVDPRYDAVMKETHGICIYQEELMKLAVAYGMTQDEADTLRKAVSKKKTKVIKALKNVFHDDAAALGTPEEHIKEIWQIINDAGSYLFNQAHAMSYGILTYVSAWLKVHYPLQFMANTLTNAYESGKDTQRIEEMVEECQRIGIQFLPVDASKSEWRFTVEDGKLRIGLCALKAFGKVASDELKSIGVIDSFDPIIEKFTTKGSKLNKKALTVLIFSGAFNSIETDKTQLLYKMIEAKASKKAKAAGIELPESFTVCAGCTLSLNDNEDDIEMKLLKVNYLYRPGADLAPIQFAQKAGGTKFTGVVQISSVKKIMDKRGQEMAFVSLSASDSRFEGIIFGSTYSRIDSSNVRKGRNVRIMAKKEKEDSCIIYDLAAA